MKIVLASASPRRRELIRKIYDLQATVVPSDIVEDIGECEPVEYVKKLAELKAKSFSEAEQMFKELCGRTHSVITGVCVTNGERTVTDCVTTYVTFGDYDPALVQSYIMSGSPFDKAGGYGLQDAELKALVVNVDGDRDNVVGLPVKKLEEMLKVFREIVK